MRANKIILSMAVAAALPFTANATQTIVQTQTPAAVGANGTVKKAATGGPYVTNEPTAADQTHIATTAYVKGAYNDAIAAVNKVDDSKQDKLYNGNTEITNNVYGAFDTIGHAQDLLGHMLSESDDSVSDILNIHGKQLDELDGVLTSVSGTIGAVVAGAELIRDTMSLRVNGNVITPEVTPGENMLQGAYDITNPIMSGYDLGYVVGDMINTSNFDETLTTAAGVLSALAMGTSEVKSYVDNELADKQDNLTTRVNNQSQNISSTVAQTVNTTTPSATTLVSEAAIAGAINGVTTNLSTNYATNTTLNSKRVRIYTTWDNDTLAASTLVPFETAQ